jgi:hypothetical protein
MNVLGLARGPAKRILKSILAVVAFLYFCIDALFLSIVRLFAAKLCGLPGVDRLARWLGSLGPYPTLILFLVPLAVLEPVKPVGIYLIGSGRIASGILVIVVGEVLKVTLVERLFHLSRDKLMSIPAFAWCYGIVTGWLATLRALPIWQLMLRYVAAIRALARRLLLMGKSRR